VNEPIRLLHFADLHVGMENYGHLDPSTGTSSRVRDFLDRLDEVVEYALAHEADLVVFAGDAFKSRDPDPTQQREFAQRIKRLADAVPTLLLVGNHDMPGMREKASSVDIFRALAVPGVIVGHKAEGRLIETQRGPVYMAWMPYPMRNRLLSREENRGKSLEELELALRSTVSEVLRDLAAEADSHDCPRILAGHFTVAEAKFGSERSVMLGRDVAVLRSTLMDARWDYVALGHIHRHQDLHDGAHPPVVYSGSLERIDFGEEAEPKGFCWAEVQRGRTEWRFVPVQARAFRTVDIDVRQADDPTAEVLAAVQEASLAEAVVRLRVQLHPEQEAALHEREVEQALDRAAHLSIARQVDMESRARLDDLEPETLTPLALLEAYLHARGLEAERIENLLEKAEELLS
jgi:exonuclease SbcD